MATLLPVKGQTRRARRIFLTTVVIYDNINGVRGVREPTTTDPKDSACFMDQGGA